MVITDNTTSMRQCKHHEALSQRKRFYTRVHNKWQTHKSQDTQRAAEAEAHTQTRDQHAPSNMATT